MPRLLCPAAVGLFAMSHLSKQDAGNFVQVPRTAGLEASRFGVSQAIPSQQAKGSFTGTRSVLQGLFAAVSCTAVMLRSQVIRRAKGKPQTTAGLRIRKPMNNALRHCSIATFEELTEKKRYNPLVITIPRKYGHRAGKICSAARISRESGHKYKWGGSQIISFKGSHKARKYRVIDFARSKRGMWAEILTVEYDPFRNARICLVKYEDGERRYILHALGYFVGQQIISAEDAPVFVGNSMPLGAVPAGTQVHNVESRPGNGGNFARGAGTSCYVLARDDEYTTVKMPGSEVRLLKNECWCTIGKVGRIEHQIIKLGKAGKSRQLGFRPHTRGKAKNAKDHPHGGGEGKSPIGHKARQTPFGKPIGLRTRRNKGPISKLILVPSWKKSGRSRKM